jgi:hypothetical protein
MRTIDTRDTGGELTTGYFTFYHLCHLTPVKHLNYEFREFSKIFLMTPIVWDVQGPRGKITKRKLEVKNLVTLSL